MGKEPVPNVPAVARFVREVLGCNCPEEVFRHIEIQRGSSALKACSADCELGAFEAVLAKDERTHLHVLGKAEIPNFFV